MGFRFDEIEKDDLRAINGNLYLRHGNQWYLFVKGIKGYTTETGYGKGTILVTDSGGLKHLFFTYVGFYQKPNNVEAVMGNFVSTQYIWQLENLVENSNKAEEVFDSIRETLGNMNGEADLLKSVNKFTAKSDYIFDLPDVEEEEEETDDAEDEDERNGYY